MNALEAWANPGEADGTAKLMKGLVLVRGTVGAFACTDASEGLLIAGKTKGLVRVCDTVVVIAWAGTSDTLVMEDSGGDACIDMLE